MFIMLKLYYNFQQLVDTMYISSTTQCTCSHVHASIIISISYTDVGFTRLGHIVVISIISRNHLI